MPKGQVMWEKKNKQKNNTKNTKPTKQARQKKRGIAPHY